MHDPCNEVRACTRVDGPTIALIVAGVVVGTVLITTMILALNWLIQKRRDNDDDDDEEPAERNDVQLQIRDDNNQTDGDDEQTVQQQIGDKNVRLTVRPMHQSSSRHSS